MDPLDELFAAMRVHSALYARLEAGAPWGLSLAGGEAARFGMVVRGGCLLEVPGRETITLAAGDCYVLPHGTPYLLRDAPRTPTVSCASVVRDRIGGVVRLGAEGPRATVLCGWFLFDKIAARPLLDVLPDLIHMRMDTARAQAVQATLQLLAMETGEPGLGSSLVVSRLADILFVQAVRSHAQSLGDAQGGWLAALADPRLGPALRAMHKDIARGWTVDSLAEAASLSRSAFALRFRQRVGESPLEYLTRWRMFKAGRLLQQPDAATGEVAGAVGYDSEAAFSKAFKRVTGLTPGAWRSRGGAITTAIAAGVE
jgi:AraC-like DNA-binding protein